MSAEGPRDWDKELADIDKIMAKSPAPRVPQTPAAPGARPSAPMAAPSAGPAPVPRGGAMGTWLRVGLGAALAVGMTQWPYFHACGTQLFIYLGAVGILTLTGAWGMVSSWRRRLGTAHLVSFAVVLWALGLAASTVLPRIGYAKLSAVWFCP